MTWLAFCPLVGLGVLAAIIVAVIVTARSATKTIGILFLVLIGLATTVGVPMAIRFANRTNAIGIRKLSEPSALSPLLESAPSSHSIVAECPFPADVYPSLRSATEALAEQVFTSLETVVRDEQQPARVVVSGNVHSDMIARIAEMLRGRGLSANVEVPGAGQTTKPVKPSEQNVVEVNVTSQGSSVRGTIQVALIGPSGQRLHSSAFINKPWADDFADFVNRHSDGHWILARSVTLGVSPEEALEGAVKDGASQMAVYVRQHLMRDASGLRLGADKKTKDLQLEAIISRELRRGAHVTDRFVQRFRRPYGDVWREALLISASPENIKALADQCVAQRRQWRSGRLSTALSMVGLLGLIIVLYLFLNAATKGYYVWSLRAAAVVFAVAAIFFLRSVF